MHNRILYRVGLSGAVAMICFTVFLIWERINQIDAIQSGFWDNLAYTTSQADFELIRLIDALSEAQSQDAETAADTLFIRYEVALSRLVGMTEGRTGQRILANEHVRETILSAMRSLEALEADILGYTALPADRQAAVKASLREISATFHGATVTIASLGDRDQNAFYLSLARAARFEILMLVLIALAGALAFSNALLERRRFQELNRSLADTVAKRTAALEHNNARLEDEVAERRQAEQRFRTLVEHATDAIVIADVDRGTLIEANPRAEALFGLPREKLVGRYGPAELSPALQPDGRRSDTAALAYMHEALDGDFPTFEWIHRSVDGVDIPCQIALARFPDPNRRLVRASVIDLTERKRAEQARIDLETQLAQAQKLETVGQMTGGVAHDFNNLLSVIVGNLELLSDETKDDESREFIQAAIDASMRGADLTRSMLNFARRAHLRPVKIMLSTLVRDMDNWISRTIPANIRIERSIKADLWPIEADVAGTESALLNLVVNACDAMPEGGVLVIETENVEIADHPAGERPDGLEPGHYVMLAISDTGTGIAPEVLAKVFDPFFSTKGPAENSGLGLSMVHGFMTQSDGSVRIYSEVGMGTTVKLFFPASGTVDVAKSEATAPSQNPAKPARILLAEDQQDVLRVLKRSLEALGHEVQAAESGQAAAVLFEAAGPFDLLVTDVVMPGALQGPALARKLRGLVPDLPVIFMSGYATEAALHGNGLRTDDLRLMKPVARKKLVEAVNTALQSGHAADVHPSES